MWTPVGVGFSYTPKLALVTQYGCRQECACTLQIMQLRKVRIAQLAQTGLARSKDCSETPERNGLARQDPPQKRERVIHVFYHSLSDSAVPSLREEFIL